MVVLKIMRTSRFNAETFISMVRWRLANETGADHSFGYATKSGKIARGLEKSHQTESFIAAGRTSAC